MLRSDVRTLRADEVLQMIRSDQHPELASQLFQGLEKDDVDPTLTDEDEMDCDW